MFSNLDNVHIKLCNVLIKPKRTCARGATQGALSTGPNNEYSVDSRASAGSQVLEESRERISATFPNLPWFEPTSNRRHGSQRISSSKRGEGLNVFDQRNPVFADKLTRTLNTDSQSIVITGSQVISRMPEWVEQPNEFIPERFDPASGFKKLHPYVSIPFGVGPRQCIARRLADLSVYALIFRVSFFEGFELKSLKCARSKLLSKHFKLALLQVFRRYHVKWNSDSELDCVGIQLNMPDTPLQFKFTPRSK
jgi:hypothetical protein